MRVKISILIFVLAGLFSFEIYSQKTTPEQYVEKYKYIAIKEMHDYKIPASITLAQGILESASGNSELAKNANNHFGIKCHKDWEGERYYYDDDEKDECFRVYTNPEESFKDHSIFLQKDRYKKLFTFDITDYKKWAKELKNAGYATDPHYPKRLIDLIERYGLDKYDKITEKQLEKMLKENDIDLNVDEEVEIVEEETEKIEKEILDPESTEIGIDQREIKYNNRIKYIIAKKDDNVESLSEELDIWKWQIHKYNELGKNQKIEEGMIVYLQPKRWKAEEKFHTVKEGETAWDVSQKYGIKLKWLYKRNRMQAGEKIEAGDKLWLRKKKPIELIEEEKSELPGIENGEVKASEP
jgi:hypothetical protein